MNIVNSLLKRYDMNETRFLKHPISTLNSYIESDKFKDKRKMKEARSLEEGISNITALDVEENAFGEYSS